VSTRNPAQYHCRNRFLGDRRGRRNRTLLPACKREADERGLQACWLSCSIGLCSPPAGYPLAERVNQPQMLCQKTGKGGEGLCCGPNSRAIRRIQQMQARVTSQAQVLPVVKHSQRSAFSHSTTPLRPAPLEVQKGGRLPDSFSLLCLSIYVKDRSFPKESGYIGNISCGSASLSDNDPTSLPASFGANRSRCALVMTPLPPKSGFNRTD